MKQIESNCRKYAAHAGLTLRNWFAFAGIVVLILGDAECTTTMQKEFSLEKFNAIVKKF